MRRTVWVIRHAHHQRVGLPLGNAFGDDGPTCIAFGIHRGLWLCLAQHAAAVCHAGAFNAKVKR